MNKNQKVGLFNTQGQEIPLQGVKTKVLLEGVLAQVVTTQEFINKEQDPIEAVFTFPLPMDTVLLDLSVTIGARMLRGTVVEKSEAEESYEDAITDGDTAIMLQQVEDGLFTMNVGNLMSGEHASITFSYAEMLRWNDNRLRLMLPTVVAPRYGTPSMESHQIPDVALDVEHRCTLSITVKGKLAHADFHSPTHAVVVRHLEESTQILPEQEIITMDRDFILNITSEQNDEAVAISGDDGDQKVVMAAFHPKLPEVNTNAARNVLLVIDCSGSMCGDSIEQAQKALYSILDTLRPQDHFNVIRFGSTHESFFPTIVQADEQHLMIARKKARQLDADLGGTEMGEALTAAYEMIRYGEITADLLLITDGEVWDSATILDEAKRASVRIFTVGVGSSVAEAVVIKLAEKTGGAFEMVTPNEQMGEAIVRHFKRIFEVRAVNSKVTWPTTAMWETPQGISSLFSNDTVILFGSFQSNAVGEVTLTVEFEGGKVYNMKVSIEPAADTLASGMLARIATAFRIRELGKCKGSLALALQYQLLTSETNYLVIDQHESNEKNTMLPQLRKVPQMLAAGWGGVGGISSHDSVFSGGLLSDPCNLGLPEFLSLEELTIGEVDTHSNIAGTAQSNLKELDNSIKNDQAYTMHDLRLLINELVEYLEAGNPFPNTYNAIVKMDHLNLINIDSIVWIEKALDSDFTEQEVVVGFFNWLRHIAEAKEVMPRDTGRYIRIACKYLRHFPDAGYYTREPKH